jgi:hypothetical protein
MTNESLNRRSTWQRHLDDQLSSGLSQRDFCASRGLSLASFGYWKRRLARSDLTSACDPLFVPFHPERPHPDSVRLSRPGGLTVEIPFGSDLRWIRRLVEEVVKP